MRNITGYSRKNSQVMDGDVDRANNLNLFFNRFDGRGGVHPTPASTPPSPTLLSDEADSPAPLSPGQSSSPTTTTAATATAITSTDGRKPLSFTVDEVRAELMRLRAGKAAGPDGVCPRLLKDCSPTGRAPPVDLQQESSNRQGPSAVENILSRTSA